MTTRPSTSGDQSVYSDVHGQILAGQLAPGSQLTESGLAKYYGVSRTPVREALARLAYEGLVERYDRVMRVRILEPEDVLEIYEVRISLESAAARAAAMRRTDLDLARLKRGVERMQGLEQEDVEIRPELAHAFHFGIWEASHNRTLIDALENLHQRVLALASTTLHYSGRWGIFVDECVDILRAIESQNADLASQVTTNQMVNARDFRVELYSGGAADNGDGGFL